MTTTSTYRRKKAIPQASRRAVALRYGCPPGGEVVAYCPCGKSGTITWWRLASGKPGAWVHFSRPLELDHIVPEFHGGTADPDNLQLLCEGCNRRKGHRV